MTDLGKTETQFVTIATPDEPFVFRSGESLDALQARTKCGTNCGSCVPELKRLQHGEAN